MFFFTKYIYQILDRYRTHLELIDTIPIGFTGVASERPAPIFTNEVSEDVLYFSSAIHSYCGEIERIRTNAPALLKLTAAAKYKTSSLTSLVKIGAGRSLATPVNPIGIVSINSRWVRYLSRI